MSGVYQRNRGLSEREFFKVAVDIRIEVNRLMASSSVVPKSYRLLNAVPTVETARDIVKHVVTADSFYPNTQENVESRRYYLTLAISDCKQLKQDFQCLISLGIASPKRFETVVQMIDREISLIRGVRKSVRLIERNDKQ